MMGRVAIALLSTIVFLLSWPTRAWGQDAVQLLAQARDGGAVTILSTDQRAELGDPFFNLVLREHPETDNLADIETRLRGDTGTEATFVVSETLADPQPQLGGRPAGRRAILAFQGTNQGEPLQANVMLSVNFNSDTFADIQDVEAWGWDEQRGRYNYYKLDRQGTPARLSWKFRNSSIGAEQLSANQRFGTCLQCHINGGPIMKELGLPWNNWHSSSFQADYLQARWPVGTSPRIGDQLTIANDLELNFMVPALQRFNRSRITAHLVTDGQGIPITAPDGTQQVTAAPELLRSLFTTTEFNLISAREQTAGLHPFSEFTAAGPFSDLAIPDSFFLNAKVIGGNSPNQISGLQIGEALDFSTRAQVTPEEYQQLVSQSGVRLGNQAGDANFAWFGPEASQIDSDLVNQLLNQGIVTPEFVASVMAIDLETPLLSVDRASLLQFIPEQFRFQPLPPGPQTQHPDALTTAVIANLEAAAPAPESAAGQWLALLQSEDPVALLRQQVIAYRDRIDTQLNQSGSAARQTELQRLFNQLIAQRQAIEADPTLRPLDEFGLLFPLP